MDGKNVCEHCSKELEAGTSITFTPTDAGAKEKHICISCFENMSEEKGT